jgi:AraC family transcriptional regulator
MPLHFRPGEFYGALQDGARCSAFDIRAMQATIPEHGVHTHTHEDAHFVLVLSGIYISSARGAPRFARAPALVYNAPGTTHRDRFVDGRGSFMTVSMNAALLEEADDLRTLPPSASMLSAPSSLRSAFVLAREVRGGADSALLEAGAWELLLAAGKAQDGKPLPGWTSRAYEAAMDLAGDPFIRVADIAEEVDVHPVHLARVFRQAFGCSPGDMLRWRRMDRACALLREATLGLAEVAAAVGFTDQSHMTHAFRERFGITPGSYRQLMFQGYKTVPALPE